MNTKYRCTGDLQLWQTCSTAINSVTGPHNVFLHSSGRVIVN